MLEHPGACEVTAIGRALVPLDEQSTELVQTLLEGSAGLRLSDAARRALLAQSESEREGPAGTPDARSADDGPSPRYDVEFRRDRRGEHWLLIAAERAPLARVLAARAGLRALEGPSRQRWPGGGRARC